MKQELQDELSMAFTSLQNLDISTRRMKPMFLILAMAVLAACGGGGDDEDEPVSNDADLTGLWSGTDTRDGGLGVPVTLIVAPGGPVLPPGSFFSVSSELYLRGVGDTSGNSFSADADGWPSGSRSVFPDSSAKALFTLDGTGSSKSSMNGSYSGGGESGTLRLTYNSGLSSRGASLATVAGSYVTDAGGALAITNGEITYHNANAGANCIGNGEINFDQATLNVYGWEIVFSGCDHFNGAAGGLAYLSDAAAGGSNNRLLLFGTTQGAPPSQIPLTIAATK